MSELLVGVETGERMPPRSWVFAGSRVIEDGRYMADLSGNVAGLVNFDSNVIDVAELASDANDTLLWRLDPAAAPPPACR